MEDHKSQTFTQKLYHILTLGSPHIYWSQDGKYFIILSPEKFSSEILPTHYSHCNFASFVRQLNMYGFRKLADMSQIGSSSWCFEHSFFTRDAVDYSKIERKVKTKSKNTAVTPSPEIKKEALTELKDVIPKMDESKDILQRFDNRIVSLQHENMRLWEEVAHIDDLAKSQEEINNKLLSFIASNISFNNDLPAITKEPFRAHRQLSWDATSFPTAKKQYVKDLEEDDEWRSLLSNELQITVVQS